jgi:hypothetical protein
MAFSHTKKVDIRSFFKNRIRIRTKRSESGSATLLQRKYNLKRQSLQFYVNILERMMQMSVHAQTLLKRKYKSKGQNLQFYLTFLSSRTFWKNITLGQPRRTPPEGHP